MLKRNIGRMPLAAHGLPDRKFVTALARGLRLLGEFETGETLGNQDLAARTGMPRATVTRLTYTLTTLGYLRLMPNGRYGAGVGFLGLSASIQRNLGVQAVARPLMETLAAELNCSVIMGMRDRHSMVFLEVVRPTEAALTINTDAGSLLPIHSTAIGLAYLAAAPLGEREEVLALVREECEADWDTVRKSIEEACAHYRRHGFVPRLRSWHRDVNAVAVPLVLEGSQDVYSFICAGPSWSSSRRVLTEQYGPRLKAVVAQIKVQAECRRPRLLPASPRRR